jgi:hypothetical protein
MRCSFGYGLKETIAAVVLSCFIAGGVGAVTTPSVANSTEAVTSSVNRTNKADRLPQAPTAKRSQRKRTSTDIAPLTKRTPLGCDPAFSTVVEPTLAHIFKRCLV